jgi:hypothetical protein
MTFMEGFAAGYIPAQKAREDRKHEEEDTQFKYSMESLMADKKLRVDQQLKEEGYAKAGADLATQLGDPKAAGYFHRQLANGVSYDSLYKGIGAGEIVPNEHYTAPEVTVQAPNDVVPSATSSAPDPAVTGAVAPAAAKPAKPGFVDPYVTNVGAKSPAPTPVKGTEVASVFTSGNPHVDARIDKLDPNLRKPQIAKAPTPDTTGEYAYTYKPKGQTNLADLGTLLNNQKKAIASGDPAQIRETSMAVESRQTAMAMEASQNPANAGQNYIITDENGNMKPGGVVSGTIREDASKPGQNLLFNAGDAQGQPIAGVSHHVSPQQLSDLTKMTSAFGDASRKYSDGLPHLVSATRNAAIMSEILDRNPAATTSVGRIIENIQTYGEDVSTAYETLKGMRKEAYAKSKAHDYSTIEKDADAYSQQVEKVWKMTLGADPQKKIGLDAVLYDAARTGLAMDMSAANGLSASKASDKDFINNMKLLGGITSESKNAKGVLNQTLTGLAQTYKAARYTIENNPDRNFWEYQTGVKTNLHAPDPTELFEATADPQTRAYWHSINDPIDKGHAVAAATAEAQGGVVRAPPAAGQPAATSPTEQAPKKVPAAQEKPVAPVWEVGRTYPGAGGKQLRLKNPMKPGQKPTQKDFEEVK